MVIRTRPISGPQAVLDAGLEAQKRQARSPEENALTDDYPVSFEQRDWQRRLPSVDSPLRLLPFARCFDASKKRPTIAPGETPHGFSAAEVLWLFDTYWQGPPGWSISDLIEEALKAPAFSGRESIPYKAIGKLIGEFPESFPWDWSSRNVAVASHLLVDALLEFPRGTSVTKVVDGLRTKYPGYPSNSAFSIHAKETWVEDPDRFPFTTGLNRREDGTFILEALGRPTGIERTPKGYVAHNAHNARLIQKVLEHPTIPYETTPDEVVELVNERIHGGFTKKALYGLREHGLPTWQSIQRKKLEAMCELIHTLHVEEKINGAGRMLKVLHNEYDYPLYTLKQLRYFRKLFPGLVPDFKKAKRNATRERARKLLAAIQRAPDTPPLQTAKSQGYDEPRAKYLIRKIHEFFPGELEGQERPRLSYDARDKKNLAAAMRESPIGCSPADVYALLEKNSPRFVERHPLADPGDLSVVIRRVLDADEWWRVQQRRLARLMIACAKKAPEGHSFADLYERMSRRHPVAYSLTRVRDMQSKWKRQPDDFPEIADLRDEFGNFPWDYNGYQAAADKKAAIRRFRALYDGAEHPPGPEDIARTDYTREQVEAIYEAYWTLPPGPKMDSLPETLAGHAAFRGHEDRLDKRAIGAMMTELRQWFPWKWRSRSLTLGCFLFVEELEKTDSARPISSVVGELEKLWGAFPSPTSLKNASKTWAEDPERFPFASRLPIDDLGDPIFEGLVAASGIQHTRKGELVANEALARRVAALGREHIGLFTSFNEFCAVAARELGAPFSTSTFNGVRAKRFKDAKGNDILPSFNELQDEARKTLAERVHTIVYDERITDKGEIVELLEARFGYEGMTKDYLSRLDDKFPDLVPKDFRQVALEFSLEDARRLAAAIMAAPEAPYRTTGEGLGFDASRTTYLVSLIREHELADLENRASGARYSREDQNILRYAVDSVNIGATLDDVFMVIAREYPRFFQRHPISRDSFSEVVRSQVGYQSWSALQHERLESLIRAVVDQSPSPMSLSELTDFLHNEHSVRYSYDYIRELHNTRWSAKPEEHPIIAAIRDEYGRYPWEARLVEATPELAAIVGEHIRNNDGHTLGWYARTLMRDPEFSAHYPTFSKDNIAYLRTKFPGEIPYIDPLRVGNRSVTRHLIRRARRQIALRAMRWIDQQESTAGLTVAELARQIDVKYSHMLKVVREYPEEFPWYRQRPAGNIDIDLATRVAHEMLNSPLGTTPQDIVDRLNAQPGFSDRYPAFSVNSFKSLSSKYGDFVPDFSLWRDILRSKVLVDAIRTAPKGQEFAVTIGELRDRYPGAFSGAYAEPSTYATMWNLAPERFPFTSHLARGKRNFNFTGRCEQIDPSEVVDAELAARLAHLEHIPQRLPLVDAIADEVGPTYFEDCELLAVQHLLDSQVPAFDAYRRCGFNPDRASVIAVPYSSNETVIDKLRDEGWDVTRPPLDIETWVEDIRKAMYQRLESALDSGRTIVVLDDGGLVTKLLHTDPHLREHADKFRIVEQTTRGITVADKQSELATAVINVAQSWGKYVEGPMIADSVFETLMARIGKLGIESVRGMKIGVVGYGTIGEPIARLLRSLDAELTILDPDIELTEEERAQGLRLERDRSAFFSSQDLILGTTGKQSMTAEDLARLPDGCIIGSASSKLVEIDIAALRALTVPGGKIEVIDSDSHPPTVEYTFRDGRKIRLLARGFPINFDGGPENIPPEEIQLTRALMLIGAVQAKRARVGGITRLDLELQDKLLEAMRELGIALDDEAQQAALSLARLQIKEARQKGGRYRRHRGD